MCGRSALCGKAFTANAANPVGRCAPQSEASVTFQGKWFLSLPISHKFSCFPIMPQFPSYQRFWSGDFLIFKLQKAKVLSSVLSFHTQPKHSPYLARSQKPVTVWSEGDKRVQACRGPSLEGERISLPDTSSPVQEIKSSDHSKISAQNNVNLLRSIFNAENLQREMQSLSTYEFNTQAHKLIVYRKRIF